MAIIIAMSIGGSENHRDFDCFRNPMVIMP